MNSDQLGCYCCEDVGPECPVCNRSEGAGEIGVVEFCCAILFLAAASLIEIVRSNKEK